MALTKVAPALFGTGNNITSVTVGGSANTISLTFDGSGVITSATNNAVSVANTAITGNIISSQITSVANTQITGNIIAAQITSVANTQLTGLIQAAQIGSANATLITSGTLPGARLPAGSVLQVVSTTKSDTFTSSSTSFVDITGMSVSITPTSSNSKILVSVVLHCGSTGCTPRFLVLRDATSIGIGDANGSRQRASFGTGFNSDTNQIAVQAWHFLDSPATTSATTYKVQGGLDGGTFAINRNESYPNNATLGISVISTITVMEIAA